MDVDSEDSDMWPSESDSSSSSDSEDDDGQLKGRAKWLKTAVVQTKTKKDKGPKVPKASREKVRTSSVDETQKEVELSLTPVQFDCKLKSVIAGRGKRGTHTADYVYELRRLVHYSKKLGDARQVVATMQIIGAQVYDEKKNIDSVLSTSAWRQVAKDIQTVIGLLERNPGFSLQGMTGEDHADIMRAGRGELKEEDMENRKKLPNRGEKGNLSVSGEISFYVNCLFNEYNKSLQQLDPHTPEYISRLFDESLLIDIAVRVQEYYMSKNKYTGASTMASLQVELRYYKHATIAYAVHVAQVKLEKFGNPDMFHPACSVSCSKLNTAPKEYTNVHPASISGYPTMDVAKRNTEKEVKALCSFVFEHGDDRSKTRAMICQVYHHALHDRFVEARDLLLMSHLQDTITQADIPTQILFNRMMAQVGLCAFRAGKIVEAHGCLSEICSGSRTKELLAQGVQTNRYQDRNPEQEKLERRRQLPYHMHINLELLELCHLTSAMLLEIPVLASKNIENSRHVISRTFRRHLEYFNLQVFSGPPENTRDYVIAASHALLQGKWKQCRKVLLNLPQWNLFPGEGVSEQVREMLANNIQTVALRAYLLAYGSEYDSLRLSEVCSMFDLPSSKVHSIVSKLMIEGQLHANWDQATESIVMRQKETTKLQQIALRLSEKTAQLVENNERIVDLRSASRDGTGIVFIFHYHS